MVIWLLSKTHADIAEHVEKVPEKGFVWINAQQNELQNVVDMIRQLTTVTINEEHVHDCQNPQHPNFYERTLTYDILIFRSLVGKQAHCIIETVPITFFILEKIIVTINNNDEAIARVIKKIPTMNKKALIEPSNLMFIILDEIVDNFLLLRVPLLERYNDWEALLFDRNTSKIDWRSFLDFKTEVRKLRFISEEQQDVIYQWRQDNEPSFNEVLAIRYNDLEDHIKRIIRSASQLENELDTLTQLHYSLIGNRTNDTMRTLTVLSGIFLPLNLIAGIFGMNFVHMKVFQSPYAVDLTLWGMLVLAIILLSIFKLKDWL